MDTIWKGVVDGGGGDVGGGDEMAWPRLSRRTCEEEEERREDTEAREGGRKDRDVEIGRRLLRMALTL